MKKHLVIAAVSAAATLFSASAYAADAANGESLFKKCSSCHTIGDGAENGVGPQLTGIVGRAAGSVEGYKYGKSLAAAGEAGLVWTEEELSAWLVNPKKYLRAKLEDKKAKSKMSFKLKKEDDRADVIAYLATFSEGAESE